MKKFNYVIKPGDIIIPIHPVDDKDDKSQLIRIVLKLLTPVTVYHNFDGTKTEQQDALVYDSTNVFVEPLFADMDTVI